MASGKDDPEIVFSVQRLVGGVAGEPGFEPGPTESESAVLPLNYSPTATGALLPTGGGRVKRGEAIPLREACGMLVRRMRNAGETPAASLRDAFGKLAKRLRRGGLGENRAGAGFSSGGRGTMSWGRRVLSLSSRAQILVAYSFSRELALFRVVA